MTTSKVEDARLRRVARRQGLVLQKSRRRDPRALDFGLYCIINPEHGGTIHADLAGHTVYALTLEEAREWLEKTGEARGDGVGVVPGDASDAR